MKDRLLLARQKKPSGRRWLAALLISGGVSFLLFLIIVSALGLADGRGNVALIKIHGTIGSSGNLLSKSLNPEDVISQLRKAEESSSIKAVLIEINSPGGTPVASEELMKAVRDSPKPTVAVIRDIGTSGAYWSASGADYIVSSSVSLTGSIGVTASYLEYSELLSRHGVDYQRLVSAPHKDIGSPFRNITEEEKALAAEALAVMHDYFLSSVIENRNIEDEAVIDKISTALVFLGSEAMELGLVDALGGKKEAEEWLMQQPGIGKVSYVSYEKKPFLDLGGVFAEQSAEAGASFAKGILSFFSSSGVEGVRT